MSKSLDAKTIMCSFLENHFVNIKLTIGLFLRMLGFKA